MHREVILKSLAEYRSLSSEEEGIVRQFNQFVTTTPDCFERTHEHGHITGSAFILSADRSSVLFSLHAKLKKWLQLGGHADGCPDVYDVALREGVEESGISLLVPVLRLNSPIDFDIHEIPANKNVQSHLHYDVRFVFHAQHDNFKCSNESIELKWIPMDEISLYCNDASVLRVIKKIRELN